MVDHAENIDCGAFVSEKFWHHFWQKTFSAESLFESPANNSERKTRLQREIEATDRQIDQLVYELYEIPS